MAGVSQDNRSWSDGDEGLSGRVHERNIAGEIRGSRSVDVRRLARVLREDHALTLALRVECVAPRASDESR